MPGIGPAARDRDERETLHAEVLKHLPHLAVVIVKRPRRVIGRIAKSVAFDSDDPHFEAAAQGIEKRHELGRAGAGADSADEQHGLPARLAGVGVVDDAPLAGLQALQRGADRIEMVGECDRLRGPRNCKGKYRQGQNTMDHRTGSVSRLRSSVAICASSFVRSRLRHSMR